MHGHEQLVERQVQHDDADAREQVDNDDHAEELRVRYEVGRRASEVAGHPQSWARIKQVEFRRDVRNQVQGAGDSRCLLGRPGIRTKGHRVGHAP